MAAISSLPRSLSVASGDLLATTIANVLIALVLPPFGIVGLVYCWLTARAVKNHDIRKAASHLQSASAIARVTLYGGLTLAVVGVVVLMRSARGH